MLQVLAVNGRIIFYLREGGDLVQAVVRREVGDVVVCRIEEALVYRTAGWSVCSKALGKVRTVPTGCRVVVEGDLYSGVAWMYAPGCAN